MDSKPQLVLDLAGVLITNLSSSFWQELARYAGTPFPVLIEQLSAIRKDLWTGRLTEKQFWFWMQTQYPNMDKLYAYELLEKQQSCYLPYIVLNDGASRQNFIS